MRRWAALSFLLLIAAKREKRAPEDAPPPPPPPPAEEVAPEPEPEPAPPPPPEVVKNISLELGLTWADGRTRSGHVEGLERSVDFNGYEGWTSDAKKLTVQVEVGGVERNVPWADFRSITITPGKVPSDVDCTSNSAMDPVMYECTLRTTSAAVLADGTKAVVTDRHMWRFTWDSGETTELQVYKYTVRVPEGPQPGKGEEAVEEPFDALQAQLAADLKSGLVKAITVK